MTPSEVLDLLDNGFLELTDVPLVRAAVAELAQEVERLNGEVESRKAQTQDDIKSIFAARAEATALRRRVEELEKANQILTASLEYKATT